MSGVVYYLQTQRTLGGGGRQSLAWGQCSNHFNGSHWRQSAAHGLPPRTQGDTIRSTCITFGSFLIPTTDTFWRDTSTHLYQP
jgi:hypothetical protein